MKRLRTLVRRLFNLDRRPRLKGAILALLRERQAIFLDYPVTPRPRWGYGRPRHAELLATLEAGRPDYERQLRAMLPLGKQLAAIAVQPDAARPGDPAWANPWLPPIDAAVLYSMISSRRPNRYVEIGSGTSTAFARRAVTDAGSSTHITSIDPAPRSHIDQLCDTIVRRRLEDIDLGLFEELEAGDIVFMDGSHRALPNSDATVFLLEVLPRLKPGVLVHIHDIRLPDDYPEEWADRFYSEQYVLAAFLLSGRPPFKVLLPISMISQDESLRRMLTPLWESIGVEDGGHGGSFWVEVERSPLASLPAR